MQANWLSRLNPFSKPQQSAPAVATAAQMVSLASHSATIYPPVDPGIPISSVEELLAGNKDLCDRLRLHAATSVNKFDQRYLDPIARLASHINNLPATNTGLFSGQAGLLRASMELAFLSFQASDGRIFTGNETVERRHHLEPRWRYVCFAAGLLYPLGKPLDRMAVTSLNGAQWPRHASGITDWAKSVGIQSVFASWPKPSSGDIEVGPSPLSSTLLSSIIGPENLGWLQDGAGTLVTALVEIISGAHSSHSTTIASQVVVSMWEKVQQRELSRRPQTYGRLQTGSHIEPHLIAALKDLVQDGVLTLGKAPLLADSKGVYLLWPAAGEEVVKHGVRLAVPGWPNSANLIGQLMKSANLFDTTAGDDMGLVDVVDSDGEIVRAFMLRNPQSIFDGYDPDLFSNHAPRTLAATIEADPLAQKKTPPAPKPSATAPTATAPIVTADSASAEDDEDDESTAADQSQTGQLFPAETTTETTEEPAAAPSAVAARTNARETPAANENPPPIADQATPKSKKMAVEGEDIKFSDLVPESVRKELNNSLYAEVLGKILKAWNERGKDSSLMRMTDNGAAFAWTVITERCADPPAFIGRLGDMGYLYVDPSTPGRKMLKVAIPEGSKQKDAIIISKVGCNRMGLR